MWTFRLDFEDQEMKDGLEKEKTILYWELWVGK